MSFCVGPSGRSVLFQQFSLFLMESLGFVMCCCQGCLSVVCYICERSRISVASALCWWSIESSYQQSYRYCPHAGNQSIHDDSLCYWFKSLSRQGGGPLVSFFLVNTYQGLSMPVWPSWVQYALKLLKVLCLPLSKRWPKSQWHGHTQIMNNDSRIIKLMTVARYSQWKKEDLPGFIISM